MDRDRRPLRAPHDEAQALTLVRAVEETDRRGRMLSHEARRRATVQARERGDDDSWLFRRALILTADLGREWDYLPRLLRFTDPGRGLLVPSAVLAFLLGLATNALGPERRIHVLALPLAGILAWNLAVLVLLVGRRFLPFGRQAWSGSRPALLAPLERWCRRLVDRVPLGAGGDRQLVRRALADYLRQWLPAVAPLSAARIRRLLHVAALALLAGVVAGMYLRGVVFAYGARWESTFLGAGTVQSILEVVLGPAAAVLGTQVPSAAGLENPPGGEAGVPSAAPWIHLWAVTAALFAGLPRTLLTAAESFRVARLSRRLSVEVPDTYPRRLLSAVSSDDRRVDVVPYSFRPPAAVSDALRAALHDFLGARCDVRLRSPVEYGAPAAALDLPAGRCWLVLFNLAQTPEVEVHGAFLEALAGDLPDGQLLLAVVDGSAYFGRLPPGEAGETRWRERRRSWDRVISDAGLAAVHLDLRRDDADAVVAALAAQEPADA